MKNVKISVIVPVYNVEKYIKHCLDTIINQSFKEIEIIIVNDGSTDTSMDIINKYLFDNRIKVINKKNGGISSARNKGIEEANGEYIYFIDSDDFLEKETLELLYKNSNNSDIVFSNFSFYDDKTKKSKRMKFRFPFNTIEILKGQFYLCNGEEINVWNKLYKKSFLLKYNFKFIEDVIFEDQDFGFKTLLLADKISYVDKYLYNYRVNRKGSIMSSLKKDNSMYSIKIVKDKLENFFNNIKINEFQKGRLNLKLLSFYLWEKGLKDEEINGEELLSIEDKIMEIYNKRNFSKIEKKVLRIDIIDLLKNKKLNKLNLLKVFYIKNGLINLKLLKRNILK